MIFSKAEELEDRVVKLAISGGTTVKVLHARLSSEERLSLRAVYKAVDKLIAAGVLLKVGKRVIADEEWVRRVGDQLRTSPVPAPSVGEKIVHSFTSLTHLDAFWKTVVLPIEESAGGSEVFFYNPHNFWAYMPERRESEKAYYQHFQESRRHAFFTLGGDTEGDREFKRDYQNEYLQIDTRAVGALRRTDHLTVAGSLVVTVRLPKRTASRIDELYAAGKTMEYAMPELLTICNLPGNIRFILENNPLKAKKLKKLLSRNFYFPGARVNPLSA